jgi:hypothetical protein
MTSDDSFVIRPEILFRRMGDEVVLVNLDTDRIFTLNPTGARFWELLSGGQTVSAVRAKMLAEYDVSDELLGAETEALLERLEAEGFVERASS